MIAMLLSFWAALTGAPAAQRTVAPGDLARAIEAARPGDTLVLSPGAYGPLTIRRTFATPVTIEAAGATVRGLTITGGGIRWRGGTLAATAGLHSVGPPGYGAKLAGSDIRLENVLFTDAKKAVVIDQAQNVAIVGSRFLRYGEDGIIASRVRGLTIDRNRFAEVVGRPTRCAVAGATTLGVPRRDCLARGGAWTDGYHADAVQMRNGVIDATITNNVVEGATQGLTQMDTTGDAPLQRITIRGNRIATSTYHQITLADCIDCVIRGNTVRREKGATMKAVIRPGAALRCDNDVEDERSDGRCARP